MNKKDNLLHTKMSRLGLRDRFNEYFVNDDPLLKDFINDNPMTRNTSDFITSVTTSGNVIFNQYSRYWKRLKKFLVKNGFTHTDWLMLLPRIPVKKGTRFHFEIASKEQLLKVPIYCVQQIVRTSLAYKVLIERVIPLEEVMRRKSDRDLKIRGRYHFDYLTIEKILTVDMAVLPGVDTDLFERMQPSLFLLRMRLKELGFTEKDGPFMKLPLCKKPKEAYIEELVTNKGLPPDEASLAVHIGMKEKWIKTE